MRLEQNLYIAKRGILNSHYQVEGGHMIWCSICDDDGCIMCDYSWEEAEQRSAMEPEEELDE